MSAFNLAAYDARGRYVGTLPMCEEFDRTSLGEEFISNVERMFGVDVRTPTPIRNWPVPAHSLYVSLDNGHIRLSRTNGKHIGILKLTLRDVVYPDEQTEKEARSRELQSVDAWEDDVEEADVTPAGDPIEVAVGCATGLRQ